MVRNLTGQLELDIGCLISIFLTRPWNFDGSWNLLSRSHQIHFSSLFYFKDASESHWPKRTMRLRKIVRIGLDFQLSDSLWLIPSFAHFFALLVADGVIQVQPACPGKWKMCKGEERVNSNTDEMYIHVFHVLCRVVVMFPCTLVRSHPDSRGARCETWAVPINSKLPGWAW